MRLVLLQKKLQRIPLLSLLQCEDTVRTVTRKRALTWQCWYLDLRLPASRIVINIFLLLISYPVYDMFCYKPESNEMIIFFRLFWYYVFSFRLVYGKAVTYILQTCYHCLLVSILWDFLHIWSYHLWAKIVLPLLPYL